MATQYTRSGKLPVLNLLTGQKSGFSPCRGDSLNRFTSNLARPTGTWVPLAVQNFTSIGPGNEKADSAAKDGLSLTVTVLKSPASELLPRATKLISQKWQKSWNNCTGNKLQSINPTIGVYQHVRSLSRCDAVIIHRQSKPACKELGVGCCWCCCWWQFDWSFARPFVAEAAITTSISL